MLKKIIRKLRLLPQYFKLFCPKALNCNSVLFVSHSDYYESLGGTERAIKGQINRLLEENISTISIFPLFPSREDTKLPVFYGVRINNMFAGTALWSSIEQFLLKNKAFIGSAKIHHLMNWRHKDLLQLCSFLKINSINYSYYLHDLFSLSKKAYDVYSGKNKYDLFSVNSNFELINGLSDGERKSFFGEILNRAENIIVPSPFMSKTMCKYFNISEDRISISPLTDFGANIGTFARGSSKRIKVAFLGHKTYIKGSAVWDFLIEQKNIIGQYDFYHIGGSEKSGFVVNIPYSFQKSGINSAVDTLIEYDIDIVILWSLVPESYSYTLHEALCAGCYIITSEQSGNIAYTLSNMDCGKVMELKEDLITFFEDEIQVRKTIKKDIVRTKIKERNLL